MQLQRIRCSSRELVEGVTVRRRLRDFSSFVPLEVSIISSTCLFQTFSLIFKLPELRTSHIIVLLADSSANSLINNNSLLNYRDTALPG